MIVHPSIEGADLLADGRFPGYQAALEAERSRYVDWMTRPPRHGLDPTTHHAAMCRYAGAIEALDFALGKPKQMADTDPTESET